MKFLHTGDLHLGKTVNDFSMIEDQKFILRQIGDIARKEQVDAVVIAGDVYDRSVPPAEAVELLDSFLTGLLEQGIRVLMISGNHDSPERLGFAEGILEKQGLHIAGTYGEEVKQVVMEDEYGAVVFVLLPFVRPALLGEKTSDSAVQKLLSRIPRRLDLNTRYVLVSHFFVTDSGREPELSDGETTVHVGGIDNVEASCFASFHYTALGHIHKPQRIGEGNVWYAGAPLAYSFSECGHTKSVNLVTLGERDSMTVEQIPLRPLHPMRKISGTLAELLQGGSQDYIQAILTDEQELINPMATLRSVYPNAMQIVLAKNERKLISGITIQAAARERKPDQLFEDFYTFVTGKTLAQDKQSIITQLLQELQSQEEGGKAKE